MSMKRTEEAPRPHLATMFALAAVVLTMAVSLLTYFAKEDRAEIKASVANCQTQTTHNDLEIALLKQSLAVIQADLGELKVGQRELMSRLPQNPAPAEPKGK